MLITALCCKGQFGAILRAIAVVASAVNPSYVVTESFQFAGECWSGEGTEKTYSKDGSSEYCITYEFAKCDTKGGNVCSGNKTTTFIYSMQEDHKTKQGDIYYYIVLQTSVGLF